MTLPRELEPEVMDSAEDASEYNEMDHSEVNQAFIDELLAFLGTNEDFRARLDDDEEDLVGVLDVGTGTALIPALLCDQYAMFKVMAVDMAVHMLELANYNVHASLRGDRIELVQADAKDLGFESEMFDVVISNSIVHHIHDPKQCVAEIVRVVQPGGAIFVRDLMRPESIEMLESIVQTYAGDATEYCQQLFRQSLHAALTLDEMRQLVSDCGWNPDGVQATSDRHWTWAAFE